jgi:cytochrome c oxidase assembly protein subunit 17
MSGECCDQAQSSEVISQLEDPNLYSTVDTVDEKKELRPCCVCEETRRVRDECVLFYGEENLDCVKFIEAHHACLASYGFKV